MSREALPKLPPDAQAHIQKFPDELQRSAQEQLLNLSHRALHHSLFYDMPIEQSDLGEKHQPHIDLVAQHMERASRLLSFARDELNIDTTHEAESFELLAKKAKEIAIRSAKEAKQAGEADTVIKALESLLVIESLEAIGYSDHTRQAKSVARAIFAEGLATELVEATYKTFGLVALQRHNVVPLNAIAQSSPDLLRAATSLEFSDDFSEVRKGEPKNDFDNLSCGDLLALAKMPNTEHSGAGTSRNLLELALKKVRSDRVEPEVLVETLIQAKKLSINHELDITLSDCRSRREAGDSRYRINNPDTGSLDEVIVKLVQKGEEETAKGLISSSPKDIDNLNDAAIRIKANSINDPELTSTLTRLHQEKQSELRQRLTGRHADEMTAEVIIQKTVDPDSAANIPTDLWGNLNNNPSLEWLSPEYGSDLTKSAEAWSAINDKDLGEYSDLLLRRMIRMENSEKINKYLMDLKIILDDIKSKPPQTKDGRSVNIGNVLINLTKFEDPIAALEATKRLYGEENGLEMLFSFYTLVHPLHSTSTLAAFRPEDITAIAIINDYCADNGLTGEYLKHVSTHIIDKRENNPIGRAEAITEGLRLANVSANTDDALFFVIVKQKDPISFGKLISELETSLPDMDDTTHEGVLRAIIHSPNSEQAAKLIIPTLQELQKRQLTMKDIGADGLTEAMSIVDKAENDKDIDRYCSHLKIRRDCKEAYQKYLQPVLKSGDRKARKIDEQPKIADLPEMRDRFEHLDIAPELAEGMLDSWLSYSALDRLLYVGGGGWDKASAGDIDNSIIEQGNQLIKQAEALTKYVDIFGIEETIAVTDIFGIYNFIRYRPDQLHNQLLSWQSGEPPARNILASARADWNSAIADAGISLERTFGGDGLFCFEVNDELGLNRVAIAVGDRERSKGRIPQRTSGIDNFIIHGHASPKSIRLGTRGESLLVSDYPLSNPRNDRKYKIRANTYQRHLGENYRVILKACSTAGEVKDGLNIAQTISAGHMVRVEGSKDITGGDITIDPKGNVLFNGREEDGEVYGGHY